MASVTNGKGGVIDVTATAQTIEIVANPASGVHNKDAMTLKIWNTGSSTVYAQVNLVDTEYVKASSIPIPSGESFWFVGQPIKKFVLACASGETSTANYGAF